ncbi:MAG TPA: hypothetical protein DEQ02_07990 [Ruminococcaceae bacterium]|nr:hypothetical protein [Oscillospiraceae bacterium]
MPKVSEEYIDAKKNEILDAAFEVFTKKPVFAVTMQDIIDNVGFSQGAIYRYYKDIDDIIIAVHNRAFANIDYKDRLKAILKQELEPEQVIRQAFLCFAKYVQESSNLFSKIRFELLMLYEAYPKRGQKIQENLKVKESNNLALEFAVDYAIKYIESGYFKPTIPVEKILSFISVNLDGILYNDMRFKSSAVTDQTQLTHDVVGLFEILSDTVISMLGGKMK